MPARYALTIGGFLLMPAGVLAHHSFIAEYDRSQPVAVTGVLSQVEWMNPHIWFYLDVEEEDGSVTTWGFSGGAPGILMRRGISRDVLRIGDTLVVEGYRARDGSNNASGGRVTFPDGSQVFTASPEDQVPEGRNR